MNTVKNCSDVIADKLQERENQIKELLSDPNSDWYSDDPALSIETVLVTRICLSYGGPADYLEITHKAGEIEKVIYRYSDWFDTATIEVEEGSSLWQYAAFNLDILEA